MLRPSGAGPRVSADGGARAAWLERLGAAVEEHVRGQLTPARLRRLPLAEVHAPGLQTLWAGFTVAREDRRPGYLAHPTARAAYVLYYTATTAATTAAALDLSAWRPGARTAGPLRILDLGAGSLGAALGVALRAVERAEAAQDGADISIDAVDVAGPILDDGRAVASALLPAAQLRVRRGDLRDERLWSQLAREPRWDVVVVANVLNELPPARRDGPPPGARLLRHLLERCLRPGGVLLAIDPATRVASRRLIDVREWLAAQGEGGGDADGHLDAGLDADLDADLDVGAVAPRAPLPASHRGLLRPLGPCLHAAACPLEGSRDWCYFARPWDAPAVVRACDAALGHDRSMLEASFLALAPPAVEGDALAPAPATRQPLSARVIGGPMRADGVVRRYLCSDQGRLTARAATAAAPAWLGRPGRGFEVTLPANAPRRRGRGREIEVDVGTGRGGSP